MIKSNRTEQSLKIQPYNEDILDSILDFCLQNPVRPFYSRTQIKRFLTQLVSSNNYIYNIFQNSNQIAVAVLIDKIKNTTNSAILEVIGKKADIDPDFFYQYVFSLLPIDIPIQISTHDTLRPSDAVLKKHNFEFMYHSFEMTKGDVLIPINFENNDLSYEKLNLQNFDMYYHVLVKSFEQNPEISIPSLDEMKKNYHNRIQNNNSGTTLVNLNGKTVGFCSVVKEEGDPRVGEVHMIGVLPEIRGKGLGAKVLAKAISELRLMGCEKCKLMVAVRNQSALDLYKKFGFIVDQTYTVYLRQNGNQ